MFLTVPVSPHYFKNVATLVSDSLMVMPVLNI